MSQLIVDSDKIADFHPDCYPHQGLIAGDCGWGRWGGEDVTDPPVDQEEV